MQRTCEMCGKIFYARKSRVEKGGAKFCSLACSGKARQGVKMSECPVCGSKFKPHNKKHTYCSRACSKVGLERKKGQQTVDVEAQSKRRQRKSFIPHLDVVMYGAYGRCEDRVPCPILGF